MLILSGLALVCTALGGEENKWVNTMLASRAELQRSQGATIRFSKWQNVGRYVPAFTGAFLTVTLQPVADDTNNWTVIRPELPSVPFEFEAGIPPVKRGDAGDSGDAIAGCIIESTADAVVGVTINSGSLKDLHLNGQWIRTREEQQVFYACPTRTVGLSLKKGANHLVMLLGARGRAQGHFIYIMPLDYMGERLAAESWVSFPVESDWWMRDNPGEMGQWIRNRVDGLQHFRNYLQTGRDASVEIHAISNALARMSPAPAALQSELKALVKAAPSPDDRRWMDFYVKCRIEGRARFLKPFRNYCKDIVFTKHAVIGRGIYNITETEDNPYDSDLRLLDLDAAMRSTQATGEVILDSQKGVIRDPALDYDGKRLLFAWRKQRVWGEKPGAQYQIYMMDLPSRQIVRQLTSTNTYGASYEPCWLADGNIIFNSARIVQHITCGWGDCSNLHIMDDQGRYQRRLAFDQVSDNFPTQFEDGRVLYLRRDYNDRGQVFAHVLISMNPDGTDALGYYKGSSSHPTSCQHFRGIPGTTKVIGVLSGYHTSQGGRLAVMDVRQGRQRLDGIVEPFTGLPPNIRWTQGDNYGKEGMQYSHPFPMDEDHFLVSMLPFGMHGNPDVGEPFNRYALYAMTMKGERELLAAHPKTSMLQAVPVMPRKRPHVRPSMVDYRKTTGVFYIQDVYAGQSMLGVPRGTAKTLRVVALDYKYDTQGCIQCEGGPGGYGTSVCAIGMETACFDVKRIIGDAPIEQDGSVMFEVPARVPVYFQVLDKDNRMVQTMRSWTTLQPGEKMSCVGCHEKPGDVGRVKPAMASRRPPDVLKPFYGPPRGFSYRAEVQPVWDKHCIRCHKPGESGQALNLTREPIKALRSPTNPYDTHDPKREWYRSYVELTGADLEHFPKPFIEETRYIKWIPRLCGMELLPPYFAGANRSKLVMMMDSGHSGVKPSREDLDKVAAWLDLCVPFCGTYDEANLWTDDMKKYHEERVAERRRNEEIERKNIEDYIASGQGR
jgi:hypothetical protein